MLSLSNAALTTLLFGAVRSEECTPCPDERTPIMIKKRKRCMDFPNVIASRCTKEYWINSKFCQYSCFKAGWGYEGDNCCLDGDIVTNKQLNTENNTIAEPEISNAETSHLDGDAEKAGDQPPATTSETTNGGLDPADGGGNATKEILADNDSAFIADETSNVEIDNIGGEDSDTIKVLTAEDVVYFVPDDSSKVLTAEDVVYFVADKTNNAASGPFDGDTTKEKNKSIAKAEVNNSEQDHTESSEVKVLTNEDGLSSIADRTTNTETGSLQEIEVTKQEDLTPQPTTQDKSIADTTNMGSDNLNDAKTNDDNTSAPIIQDGPFTGIDNDIVFFQDPTKENHYQALIESRNKEQKGEEMAGTFGSGDPLQLLMFWEEQYEWQDTRKRRRFCVQCSKGTRGGCRKSDSIRLMECDDNNKRQWWIRDGEKIRAYTDKDLCWDYSPKEFYELKECGSSSEQNFVAKRSSLAFNRASKWDDEGFRFELQPKTKRNSCSTNRHHPKEKEALLNLPCDRARDHDTAWFIAVEPGIDGH